jgi:hypothetical protein
MKSRFQNSFKHLMKTTVPRGTVNGSLLSQQSEAESWASSRTPHESRLLSATRTPGQTPSQVQSDRKSPDSTRTGNPSRSTIVSAMDVAEHLRTVQAYTILGDCLANYYPAMHPKPQAGLRFFWGNNLPDSLLQFRDVFFRH